MKKFLLGLMALLSMTVCFTACGDDSKDDPQCNDCDNTGLAGTIWQRTNESDDTYYGAKVIYTVTFDSPQKMSFNRNVDGTDNIMTGSFTYKNGKGTMKGKTIVPVYNPETEDYENQEMDFQATFTISGDELTFHYSLRDVVLTKQN